MSFSAGFLTGLLPSDPVSWIQVSILGVAIILIYLLLFTLRDILLRTRSFWYQFFCVLLVGCLPVLGFFLYLLIRPARTVKERHTDFMLSQLMGEEDSDEYEGTEEIEEELEEIEDVEELEEADDNDEISSVSSISSTPSL